nr:hypothetical protein Q903MT_gene6620 [Picea sitchensis]
MRLSHKAFTFFSLWGSREALAHFPWSGELWRPGGFSVELVKLGRPRIYALAWLRLGQPSVLELERVPGSGLLECQAKML